MINKTQDEFKRLCYWGLSDEERQACHIYAWFPSDRCRYCGEPIQECDFESTRSYWLINGIPGWFPSHKQCKTEGYRMEAYECQKIDADCNDCFYLNREASMCLLDGSHRIPRSGFCSGMKCFIHRKDNGQR